jgi:hypothetical protein
MASIDKFIASDVAWLAGGASTDGQHAVDPDLFFKEFDDLRNATPSGTAGALPTRSTQHTQLTSFEGNLERRAWGELTRKVIHDLVRTSKVKVILC